MIAIKNNITEFVYTNAPNPTTEYNPLTEYDTGDEARYLNYVYKSVRDGNIGDNPLDTLFTSWIEWGPANDYAILDYFRETKTIFPEDSDGVVIFERNYNDCLVIGNFNSTEITIEYLNDLNEVINENDTETYLFTPFMNMYNPYLYIYGGFKYDTTSIVYQAIKRIGTRLRITFKRGGTTNEVGFLFAGNAIDFGKTLNKIDMGRVIYGKKEARKADFETIVNKKSLMKKLEDSRVNANTDLAFIIDPSENTQHNNIVIIGRFTEYNGVADNGDYNVMRFSIEQNIRK